MKAKPTTPGILADFLLLVGCGCIIYAAWQVSFAVGLATAGVACVLVGLGLGRLGQT